MISCHAFGKFPLLLFMLLCVQSIAAESERVTVDTRDEYVFSVQSSNPVTIDTRDFVFGQSSGITVDTRSVYVEVSQPVGAILQNAISTSDFGINGINDSNSKNYIVRNTVNYSHTNLLVQITGENAADFVPSQPTLNTLSPGSLTNFSITFRPSAIGIRVAQLRITASAFTNEPFIIGLRGTSYSRILDTDGDGMNDLSENLLGSLGFDWQTNQAAMVSDYFASANRNGLYSESQIHALQVNAPLLQRSPSGGDFTLKIGVKKSAD